MILLAIIFLSLVYIFVRSLDNISNDFLQLPTIPEVTPTPIIIHESIGDAVECQGVLPQEEGDKDGSELNKTEHVSDHQARTEAVSDLECVRLCSKSDDGANLLKKNSINELSSSDHSSNAQYCTESVSDIEYNWLDESGDDLHDIGTSLSITVHDSERQEFVETGSDTKCRNFEKSIDRESLITNKCINDTSSNDNSTGLSALESLRRMQVICSEMREALMSASIGSDRCNDSCDLYGDEHSADKDIESLASKSSVDTTTYTRNTDKTYSGIHTEINSTNQPQTQIENEELILSQNTMKDGGSNELEVTDFLKKDDKVVIEIEQTIHTFDPTDDFDMEQLHSTTENNYIFDKKFEVLGNSQDSNKYKDASDVELENDEKLHENERMNTETVEKLEIMARNSDELVGKVEIETIKKTVDNLLCNGDDAALLSNRSSIDSPGSMVQLRSPSTISMYEMDEFLFWERLTDVIARCHKNGQKYSQNILDYYSSIANIEGKYEDSENRVSQFNSKFQATNCCRKNRIELGSEISQYLLDTNSFPRHIFEQESMNLTLGPLVVFFGGVDTSRQVENLMDEEKNKKLCDTKLIPITSDESINTTDEIQSKTMSFDTFQSDQRDSNFTRNSIGSELVCGRLVCYDSSFHSIGTGAQQNKGDKNKRKFDKFYSVYKRFENSEH